MGQTRPETEVEMKQKSLGQIVYNGLIGNNADRRLDWGPWAKLPEAVKINHERAGLAVEREVLRRVREQLPLSSACMIKLKRRAK